MTTFKRRVTKLEARLKPVDYASHPRDSLRFVVTYLGRPLNLATATCRRMLTADGFLTEIVNLGGSGEFSDQALEQFVARFPVERI